MRPRHTPVGYPTSDVSLPGVFDTRLDMNSHANEEMCSPPIPVAGARVMHPAWRVSGDSEWGGPSAIELRHVFDQHPLFGKTTILSDKQLFFLAPSAI